MIDQDHNITMDPMKEEANQEKDSVTRDSITIVMDQEDSTMKKEEDILTEDSTITKINEEDSKIEDTTIKIEETTLEINAARTIMKTEDHSLIVNDKDTTTILRTEMTIPSTGANQGMHRITRINYRMSLKLCNNKSKQSTKMELATTDFNPYINQQYYHQPKDSSRTTTTNPYYLIRPAWRIATIH